MATLHVDSESKVVETAHPSLRTLCENRQRELKGVLARLGADESPHTRHDIEAALDALDGLLTGNLDHIPPIVALQLSKWIDSSKYLGLGVDLTPDPKDAMPGAAPSPSS